MTSIPPRCFSASVPWRDKHRPKAKEERLGKESFQVKFLFVVSSHYIHVYTKQSFQIISCKCFSSSILLVLGEPFGELDQRCLQNSLVSWVAHRQNRQRMDGRSPRSVCPGRVDESVDEGDRRWTNARIDVCGWKRIDVFFHHFVFVFLATLCVFLTLPEIISYCMWMAWLKRKDEHFFSLQTGGAIHFLVVFFESFTSRNSVALRLPTQNSGKRGEGRHETLIPHERETTGARSSDVPAQVA